MDNEDTANTPTGIASGSGAGAGGGGGGGIAGIGGSMSFLRDFSVPDLLAMSNDYAKDVKDEKPNLLSNVPSVTTLENLDKRGESGMNGLGGSYTDVSALGGGASQPMLNVGPPSQELFSGPNSNCDPFNSSATVTTGTAAGSASEGVASGTNGVINGMESVGALEDKLANEIQWKQQQQQPQPQPQSQPQSQPQPQPQPQQEVKMLPAEMMGMRMPLQYPQLLHPWQILQASPIGMDSAFTNTTIPSIAQNNYQGMAVSSPDDHRNTSGANTEPLANPPGNRAKKSNSFGTNAKKGGPVTSPNKNDSTADEADDPKVRERKERRMLSNRESARRSRQNISQRKQLHLDELQKQVILLRNENAGIMQKLNVIQQHYQQVNDENQKLRAERDNALEQLKRYTNGEAVHTAT